MELVRLNDEYHQVVRARELHEFLESKQQFTDWIKSRLDKYDFIEGQDFTVHKFMIGKKWNHEYILTIDTAKEIAMVENNSKGKEARRYFIECEKRLKNGVSAEISGVMAEITSQLQDMRRQIKYIELRPGYENTTYVCLSRYMDDAGVSYTEDDLKKLEMRAYGHCKSNSIPILMNEEVKNYPIYVIEMVLDEYFEGNKG